MPLPESLAPVLAEHIRIPRWRRGATESRHVQSDIHPVGTALNRTRFNSRECASTGKSRASRCAHRQKRPRARKGCTRRTRASRGCLPVASAGTRARDDQKTSYTYAHCPTTTTPPAMDLFSSVCTRCASQPAMTVRQYRSAGVSAPTPISAGNSSRLSGATAGPRPLPRHPAGHRHRACGMSRPGSHLMRPIAAITSGPGAVAARRQTEGLRCRAGARWCALASVYLGSGAYSDCHTHPISLPLTITVQGLEILQTTRIGPERLTPHEAASSPPEEGGGVPPPSPAAASANRRVCQ